ncbi:MAG: FtsX-like permease family protein, partial [Cyclobacteriaceae bacterium]
SEVLSFLQSQWLTIAPDLPFEYNFLDETMRAQYMLEEKWEGIMNYAMAIATILSCLGLFGIVALGMESRKKEIGIRKILGAQVQQIVWLFTNSYLKLVLIAFLLAAPVSYYLINEWLATFAYRIEIKPGIFASAAAIIVVVALATITLKVLNAALRNPVEALRSD